MALVIRGEVKALTSPPLNKAILEPRNKKSNKRLKKPLSGGK